MSRKAIAVTVGILFVIQMATAMIGTALIHAFVDGKSERAPLVAGVLLMACSGLAVVAIGLLMYRVLREVDPREARWYPVLRIIEFTVSTACGVYLLIQLQVVPNQLLWIYIPTGLGGLVLNHLLYISRLVPRPIAVLGLIGYGLFTLAVPLDLIGLLDMNAGVGMLALAPGFLYELVVLPIWLIARGFASPARTKTLTAAAFATAS